MLRSTLFLKMKAKMEAMEIQGLLEFRELLDLKELLEILVQWVYRDVKETLAYLVNLVQEEIQEKMEYLVLLDQLVLQVLQVKGEHLGVQAQEDFKGCKELQEKMECEEKMVILECRVSQG